ncbi:MAG: pyridoxamine 5-phosphate oxidase-related FMN-binding protein [Firmicutes bacterium]|nr:pyridoxamine 5-phosphate oxidase-related FMN-binding protein [Bacillota bacterium]
MSINTKSLYEYLNQTKFIVLATTSDEQVPTVRTLASFAVDELTTYFSTGKKTDKVQQIKSNPQVSILFQHENQELGSFVNATITGKATEITAETELEKVIKLLSDRSPRFKERVEKGEIANNTFFRIDPQEVKVLDFSKGVGPNAIEIIRI